MLMPPRRRTTMSRLFKYFSLVLCSAAVLLSADNVWNGTWKLDPAQSTLSTAPQAAKELTIKIRPVGNDMFEVDFKGTTNNGAPYSRKYTAPEAGGPSKYREGAPSAGTSEMTKRIDKNHREITATTSDGKEVMWNHVGVSEDGKTITANVKTLGDDGKSMIAKQVFVKQQLASSAKDQTHAQTYCWLCI